VGTRTQFTNTLYFGRLLSFLSREFEFTTVLGFRYCQACMISDQSQYLPGRPVYEPRPGSATAHRQAEGVSDTAGLPFCQRLRQLVQLSRRYAYRLIIFHITRSH
jgi:hypothetical protein